MYAFCNADDISWGTKNLDTKHADHDAKKMASKALAYQVRRPACMCGWRGCRQAAVPPGMPPRGGPAGCGEAGIPSRFCRPACPAACRSGLARPPRPSGMR